jgi:metallo-beta-lactamase family protein
MARLTFLGAAETVTGSRYWLESDETDVLVDCGLFQGLKELRLKNWLPLPIDLPKLDSVVLTHAHLDHIGFLPRLVRQGFAGPIYATKATIELSRVALLDSAKIQEQDAEYANRKGFAKHEPALPLYDEQDVQRTLPLMRSVDRGVWFEAGGPFRMQFHNGGHLLGAGMIEVEVQIAGQTTRILFSGDVGRYGAPLYHDPGPPPDCDYLICESTYGDRNHPIGNLLDELTLVINAGVARGGVILVSAFAVGRAQQFIYVLQVLMDLGRIPRMPVILDSPMAVDVTEIYRAHHEDHDLAEGQLGGSRNVLNGEHVRLARTVAESKQINEIVGPAIVLASSGMMTGGRILHHLKQRLPDEKNTIFLGGFQAEGTRGRMLQNGARSLRLHGRDVPVRAAVVQVSGLSGHADRDELLRWLAPMKAPRQVYMTHGEKPCAEALAASLRANRGWQVTVPKLGDRVDLLPT